jgi:hypothetical protein
MSEELSSWEERERKRAEIVALINKAEQSIARGDVIEITKESMEALADRVKRAGRERLKRERNADRAQTDGVES